MLFTTSHTPADISRSALTNVNKVIFLVLLCITALATKVDAAVLSAVPTGTGTYGAGQLFSVSARVSTSDGESVNAVSGVLSFSNDIIQLVSIDKTGSIIDFWIGDSSYSNAEGRASFEGGIYNPGYAGSNGKVVTFLFKAKSAGTAQVSFSSASVLANDGRGTNILDRTVPASITVQAGTPAVAEQSQSVATIAVRSNTHPDQNAWYASKDVSLSWDIPAGATSLRTGFDQSSSAAPTKLVSPPVSATDVVVPVDGTWYFHIQARDATGWGPVGTFKIHIDTATVNPPVFDQIPQNLTDGEALLISGSSEPLADVLLTLKDANSSIATQASKADATGRFQTVWNKKLAVGSYTLSGITSNAHMVASHSSADMVVSVRPPLAERIAVPIVNYVSLFIAGMAILFLCGGWIWYLMYHLSRFKSRTRAKVRRADQKVQAKLKKLEDMVIDQVRLLEKAQNKRPLTTQEEKIIASLGTYIENIEKGIEKDIEEIGK